MTDYGASVDTRPPGPWARTFYEKLSGVEIAALTTWGLDLLRRPEGPDGRYTMEEYHSGKERLERLVVLYLRMTHQRYDRYKFTQDVAKQVGRKGTITDKQALAILNVAFAAAWYKANKAKVIQ